MQTQLLLEEAPVREVEPVEPFEVAPVVSVLPEDPVLEVPEVTVPV